MPPSMIFGPSSNPLLFAGQLPGLAQGSGQVWMNHTPQKKQSSDCLRNDVLCAAEWLIKTEATHQENRLYLAAPISGLLLVLL